MPDRQLSRIRAKTASYSINPTFDLGGTRFTNRGATGAVTFTLPTLNNQPDYVGIWFEFQGVADQTFTVAAAAGKAVALNNAACASLACSTGGQKIGALIRATWDGTSWLLTGEAVGVTYTVA
jgi:hypothetical protein